MALQCNDSDLTSFQNIGTVVFVHFSLFSTDSIDKYMRKYRDSFLTDKLFQINVSRLKRNAQKLNNFKWIQLTKWLLLFFFFRIYKSQTYAKCPCFSLQQTKIRLISQNGWVSQDDKSADMYWKITTLSTRSLHSARPYTNWQLCRFRIVHVKIERNAALNVYTIPIGLPNADRVYVQSIFRLAFIEFRYFRCERIAKGNRETNFGRFHCIRNARHLPPSVDRIPSSMDQKSNISSSARRMNQTP